MDGIIELERDLYAPARARAAVEENVRGLDAGTLADVKLMVSELVTNSVQHGGAGGVELHLARPQPRCLRVEVVDEGPGFAAAARVASAAVTGGRGLEIVAAIADRWGIAAPRTRVWFEIETPG